MNTISTGVSVNGLYRWFGFCATCLKTINELLSVCKTLYVVVIWVFNVLLECEKMISSYINWHYVIFDANYIYVLIHGIFTRRPCIMSETFTSENKGEKEKIKEKSRRKFEKNKNYSRNRLETKSKFKIILIFSRKMLIFKT